MGGATSRTKGHNWERQVATMLREAFPKATVRRADQGWGAFDSDVIVEGDAPEIIKRIWWECYCGRQPNLVEGKLQQAERDTAKIPRRIPVVAWREHGARRGFVTLRLSTLLFVAAGVESQRDQAPCTLPLKSFLSLLQDASNHARSDLSGHETPGVVPEPAETLPGQMGLPLLNNHSTENADDD